MSLALKENEAPMRDAASKAIETIQSGTAEWSAYAQLALDEAACRYEDMTSDRVWEVLTEHGVPFPDEPRGMGAVMVRGAKEGLLKPTDEFRVSKEPATKRHGGRPQRVFQSLVYGQTPAKWPEVVRMVVPPAPEPVVTRIASFDEWRCPRCGRPLGGVVVNGENGVGECIDHGRQRTRRRTPSHRR